MEYVFLSLPGGAVEPEWVLALSVIYSAASPPMMTRVNPFCFNTRTQFLLITKIILHCHFLWWIFVLANPHNPGLPDSEMKWTTLFSFLLRTGLAQLRVTLQTVYNKSTTLASYRYPSTAFHGKVVPSPFSCSVISSLFSSSGQKNDLKISKHLSHPKMDYEAR